MSHVDDSNEDDLKVKPPEQWATGVPAVTHAIQYSLEQTSIRRTAINLFSINQADGVDCPGCAWPEPAPGERKMQEYCENGAKHINDEATTRRVTREFFEKYPVSVLAGKSDLWLNQQGRLTEPMVKRPGSDCYQPIGWDEAFDLLSDELRRLDSPDEALFYTSGRLNNEAAFLLQLFARALGTNNLPDCSNMCHESSGWGLGETLGIGKGSVSLQDIEQADLVFVVGLNPGTNMPRMLTALEMTKRNGGHIVAVNPLPEAGLIRFKNPQKVSGIIGRGTVIADDFLHIKPGGDLALFQAINSLVLQAEHSAPATVLDYEFIDNHTTGFAEFADHVKQLSWPDVLDATGLTRADIEQVVSRVLATNKIIVCWAMGVTQQKYGVATVREIVNFLMLRGALGRPGAGVCRVRGHSNVQGDRTMGIWEQMPQSFLDALSAEFGFAPPVKHGLDAVDSIRAMRDGKAKLFLGFAGNFVRATALNDRYRGIHNGRRVVLVNPADINELGLADRQLVDLVSTWEDGIARRATGFRVIAHPAARGSAASYYPETNVLVPLDSVAEISNTPTSKGVYVRIEPCTGPVTS